MTNLSNEAQTVLNALRNGSEGWSKSEAWGEVYLDNVRPAGMTDKTFRAYLAVLSKAGLYKVVDGYAWGKVKNS